MKNLLNITTVLFLGLIMFSCSEKQSQNDISQKTEEELFAIKTFEFYEELLTKDIPAEDIKYRVYKDANGFLTAKYKLTGQTKKKIQMGSFVKTQARVDEEGTTCNGKWSCAKAIYNCLENDLDALISEGACIDDQYCVTCQDPVD